MFYQPTKYEMNQENNSEKYDHQNDKNILSHHHPPPSSSKNNSSHNQPSYYFHLNVVGFPFPMTILR